MLIFTPQGIMLTPYIATSSNQLYKTLFTRPKAKVYSRFVNLFALAGKDSWNQPRPTEACSPFWISINSATD